MTLLRSIGFRRSPAKRQSLPGRDAAAYTLLSLAVATPFGGAASARAGQLPVVTTSQRAEFVHSEFLESQRKMLRRHDNPYAAPPAATVVEDLPAPWMAKRYSWHRQIRATVFWVGEKPTARNPVSNVASSWDPNWQEHFGGYDHPFKRKGYHPEGFTPKMNPFYVALPYNDLQRGGGGTHRSEAPEVVPWFWRSYRGPGVSVCADRWIAIHHKGRVCYAQWKDVGPFTVDDWRYVFNGERPRPNANQNAGIDVSPAVRDFLGLRGNADVDWRFVEDYAVPDGPWATWLVNSSAKDPPARDP